MNFQMSTPTLDAMTLTLSLNTVKVQLLSQTCELNKRVFPRNYANYCNVNAMQRHFIYQINFHSIGTESEMNYKLAQIGKF